MPTIDIEYAEFEKLVGIELSRNMEKVDGVLAFAKGEVKLFDEKTGVMSVEIKDTNRPDIWNVEGLARTLRGFLGLETGLKKYAVGGSLTEIYVDSRLGNIRPFIGCSVIKGIKLTDAMIRGFMHLQDKLDQSYGRNRQRTSIGLYDFDLIKAPLSYTVSEPTKTSFTPLGSDQKMNLKEILRKHPKGLQYGHIVGRHHVFPILLDAESKILSFPPIINSNDLGRITEETRNILIEVTGTTLETVLSVVKIVTLSLIDRGGKAYSAIVHYPGEQTPTVTPDFRLGKMDLSVDQVNTLSGLHLTAKQIANLLSRARFDIERVKGDKITVLLPCYRVDLMHPVDLVEDIAIAYGYNNIKPLWRNLPTAGGLSDEQGLLDDARDLMVGLGFQEVLNCTLTNPTHLFTKMNREKEKLVEISNPKVQTMTCLRNQLLPSLIEFLSNNLSVEYPQKIFELGKVTLLDAKRETRTRDENWLAAVISHACASFSEIKSTLDAFFINLGLKWEIKEAGNPSFIKGRMGLVIVEGKRKGVIGEINPKVLNLWNIENPVSAFELNMEKIAKTKRARP